MVNQFSKSDRGIKGKLFINSSKEFGTKPIATPTILEPTIQLSDSQRPIHERKTPYFIQIGFDFGTSYSKCICRDMMINKAWVHIYSKAKDQEFPFLIPTALIIKNNKISHFENPKIQYPENGLYNLKNALILAANGELSNPIIAPYQNAVRLKKANQLPGLIKICAIYFLAGILGEIRAEVRERFPGFGEIPEDYMAINLAIPVANAQQSIISNLYKRILCESWKLADQLIGYPSLHLKELVTLIKDSMKKQKSYMGEACFIYPEVSASVQGFVRSRVSSEGIYLFCDTGGSTVDQSIFILVRQKHSEQLTYLAARVLPLGSGRIEQHIAEKNGRTDWISLEKWKERKESGELYLEVQEAQNWILDQLKVGSETTIALAKKKLFRKEQLNDIRIIFSGGGHCEYPYKAAVMDPFSGHLFSKPLQPDVIGMPTPTDLALEGYEKKWIKRLNVAYGLSFEKSELARFKYPKDMPDPNPEEIWQRYKQPLHAPTKDEC